MPPTRIKICGVRDTQAARAASEAGADAVGLVFAAGSPRQVTPEDAAQIAQSLPVFVEPIGLFVDEAPDNIRRICDTAGIRTVQLHGRESPGILDGLAGLRVIRALPFDPARLDEAQRWDQDPRVSALLLDGPRGGSGVALDWGAVAASVPALTRPIILAGGLTPQNVAKAIATLRPYAVDVSSGVESAPGVKDAARIRAFCEAALRGHDTGPA